jgi:hypothetical protein
MVETTITLTIDDMKKGILNIVEDIKTESFINRIAEKRCHIYGLLEFFNNSELRDWYYNEISPQIDKFIITIKQNLSKVKILEGMFNYLKNYQDIDEVKKWFDKAYDKAFLNSCPDELDFQCSVMQYKEAWKELLNDFCSIINKVIE